MHVGHRVGTLAAIAALSGATACGGGAPGLFARRPNVPLCGGVAPYRAGLPLDAVAKQALACLAEAYRGGTKAELSYTLITTEGDPMDYWVRTLGPQGGVEQFEHSFDKFGEKGWFLVRCAGLDFDAADFPVLKNCGDVAKI